MPARSNHCLLMTQLPWYLRSEFYHYDDLPKLQIYREQWRQPNNKNQTFTPSAAAYWYLYSFKIAAAPPFPNGLPWRIKPALLKTAEFICCLESNLFGICLYCISHILVGASVRSLRFDLCLVVLIKEVMEDGFLFRSVTMGTLQATLFSACVFFKQSE